MLLKERGTEEIVSLLPLCPGGLLQSCYTIRFALKIDCEDRLYYRKTWFGGFWSYKKLSNSFCAPWLFYIKSFISGSQRMISFFALFASV